jgi:hypothetical protein
MFSQKPLAGGQGRREAQQLRGQVGQAQRAGLFVVELGR